VVVERLAHGDNLCAILRKELGDKRVAIMVGDTENEIRVKIKEKIMSKELKVLIATRKLICEGADIPALSCLHVTMPYNNRLLTEQLVGRLRRIAEDKLPPIVKDYIDVYVSELKNKGIRRRAIYKKLKFKLIDEEVLN
jgi:superfamily II DNA or RNA helicase